MTYKAPHTDSKVQFSFQLSGSPLFHLSFNHPKGHRFRAGVSETEVRINTDKDKKDPDDDAENNEFYNYKMPWSLRLRYAANYTNTRRQDQISSHSLMFSGDVELSPRWSIGISSGYDLLNQGITPTQLRFERDLLSWRMNFTFIPVGVNTSWNFFIGIKSNLLKDLKYDQRRQPDQRVGN